MPKTDVRSSATGTRQGATSPDPAGVPATARTTGPDRPTEAPRIGDVPRGSPAIGQDL